MKKYKVLTNWFRDFEEGDIISRPYAEFSGENPALHNFYILYDACSYNIDVPRLPIEFVENYPEYFEEIKKETTKDLRSLIFSLAKDIDPILRSKMHEFRLVAHSVTFEIDDAINSDINSLTIKISKI